LFERIRWCPSLRKQYCRKPGFLTADSASLREKCSGLWIQWQGSLRQDVRQGHEILVGHLPFRGHGSGEPVPGTQSLRTPLPSGLPRPSRSPGGWRSKNRDEDLHGTELGTICKLKRRYRRIRVKSWLFWVTSKALICYAESATREFFAANLRSSRPAGLSRTASTLAPCPRLDRCVVS